MPRLLSISRAARLVGVSRGALQKQIFNGELPSFEGQIKISDLEKLYPQAELEDNSVLEHIEEIVEQALHRARGEKLRALLAPDLNTLAARVSSLSKELSSIQQRESHYINILSALQEKINQQIQEQQPDFATQLAKWLQDVITEPVLANSKYSHLLAKDTLLKMVAAQVHLMPSGHEYFIEGNNSILESGLSAGLALNYGCSNGNCGKCKARLISGDVKKIRNHDYVIPEAEKNQGYLLTCCHTALTDVVLQADEAGSEQDIPLQDITAKVKKISKLDDELLLLHLKTPRTNRLRFLAGQSAALKLPGMDTDSLRFPIASCPCDDMNIQFHVRYQSGSPLVEHVFNQLQSSDTIGIEGPYGHFILREDSDRPILFFAYNEGFSPVKSLIEHAMTLENAEYIHLFWITSAGNNHYMHNVCRAWTDALDDFRYTPLSIDRADNMTLLQDRFQQVAQTYKDLDEFDIYIAGPEQLVSATVQFLEKAGVNKNNILTNL